MSTASSIELLNEAYNKLGFSSGDLKDTKEDYSTLNAEDWISKGAWLSIGKKVKAEKILFIDNNPVIIFAKSDVSDSETLRAIYNSIWCMARPRLLFLAKPGELAVYDLAQTPFKTIQEWQKHQALDVAHSLKEVSEKLRIYAREQIETGYLFRDSRFSNSEYRADKSLIRDLKIIRSSLMKGNEGLNGEKLKYAHALIGRSIFIRYLEDRRILTPEYFFNVAIENENWIKILNEGQIKPDIDPAMDRLLYPRVLGDKTFTYALFSKLARDFNGDMFPQSEEEKQVVTQQHLSLLQNFLRGDIQEQKQLFFFAYRFDVIPLELISNIYEEFYQVESGGQKTHGSYYTPPALVDFIVSKVLTMDALSSSPQILDPACGSGVFLVESFKQIVRYRCYVEKKYLQFDELVRIIQDQISGIDINAEAIQIAAFSLYLAMLNFLEPPNILELIRQGYRLPHLIAQKYSDKRDSLNTLLVANAFSIEEMDISESLKKKFSSNCADIIVTNPPWGSPDKKDIPAVIVSKIALDWCTKQQRTVGDKERSQTFLWKAIDSLRIGGTGALLVSAGMLHKYNNSSIIFRDQLLSSISIDMIFNFTNTRKVFFKESISPFIVMTSVQKG